MTQIRINMPPELKAAIKRIEETGEPVLLMGDDGKNSAFLVPNKEVSESTPKRPTDEEWKAITNDIMTRYHDTFKRLAE